MIDPVLTDEPSLADAYSLPLEDINLSDPYLFSQNRWEEYFQRVRDEDPVHYLKDSPFGPFWSITRFEDIVAVDTNHEVFSSEPFIMIGDPDKTIPITNFISMDPPKHDEQRAAVQSVVAPRNLAAMEDLIRERISAILDQLPVGKSFDWVSSVSMELTSQMLATIFDFPYEERHKLVYWSDMATGAPELSGGTAEPEERFAALNDMVNSFTTLWKQKAASRKAGSPVNFDLISLMESNEDTRDMITRPEEFMGNLGLLIVGGNDTTRNSITGSVLAMNKFPDQFAKLRANPKLIPNMVSEIIRWQTPLSHMRRIAKRDIELGGKLIKKGDKVVMWYASGNRDERVIDNPNQVIIDRANARHHLSFGFGIHRCMGNRLGEMQLRITWEEILKRFDDVKVMEEPERVHSNFVNGYSSMQVKLTPKAA
ncbi:Linalool 8-monooxygenase [Zhongshania aliphaticivorans]|uniref:Linalool 8-monooxygenase n=1 Tax=Zhongshania aliphaticivorans TaxID=1470434 RepID=A0A5S9Q339_9GAMM|nr:cytochrome P450 [Zhongshania aliphaticivorans]CAA0111317.1 Linalool 8-monooxygenase [Zhongshania aliphaticivorans]CAA0118570.1 Linalool 8-monooxygenase [Zhongshania aliphaticivorans]